MRRIVLPLAGRVLDAGGGDGRFVGGVITRVATGGAQDGERQETRPADAVAVLPHGSLLVVNCAAGGGGVKLTDRDGVDDVPGVERLGPPPAPGGMAVVEPALGPAQRALGDDGEEGDGTAALDPSLGDGPLLGKRYVDDEAGLELLCTRPGQGALTADGRPLVVKGAKPLPASD